MAGPPFQKWQYIVVVVPERLNAGGICFDEETFPAVVPLQGERVGATLAVKGAALHEEAAVGPALRILIEQKEKDCLLYTSPSPRDS